MAAERTVRMDTRLGKWLALTRGELGLSLRATAVAADASSGHIADVERGKPCSADLALRMARALGADPEKAFWLWILDRDEKTRDEANAAWDRMVAAGGSK